MTVTKAERIALLNDELRKFCRGGRVMITAGIMALESDHRAAIMQAVQLFDSFDPGNEEDDEHDWGIVTVRETTAMFKIDYYDKSFEHASDDPSDPGQTIRVMTVMLAEEY